MHKLLLCDLLCIHRCYISRIGYKLYILLSYNIQNNICCYMLIEAIQVSKHKYMFSRLLPFSICICLTTNTNVCCSRRCSSICTPHRRHCVRLQPVTKVVQKHPRLKVKRTDEALMFRRVTLMTYEAIPECSTEIYCVRIIRQNMIKSLMMYMFDLQQCMLLINCLLLEIFKLITISILLNNHDVCVYCANSYDIDSQNKQIAGLHES